MKRWYAMGWLVACVLLAGGGQAQVARESAAPALGTQVPSQQKNAENAVLPREAVALAEDPLVEARLVNISQELRCLVCQNESLASSRAELADDLRREVRDLIRAQKTDPEIKDFLVSRYGDFVLYRPEVKPLTWVLWFGPFVVLGIAAVFLLAYLRQRRLQVVPQGLSDNDRARVEQLLKE